MRLLTKSMQFDALSLLLVSIPSTICFQVLGGVSDVSLSRSKDHIESRSAFSPGRETSKRVGCRRLLASSTTTEEREEWALRLDSKIDADIDNLCQSGKLNQALETLERYEKELEDNNTVVPSTANPYIKIMQAIASSDEVDAPDKLEKLLEKVKEVRSTSPSVAPISMAYNALMLSLSKSHRRDAGVRCEELLEEMWAMYNETNDSQYLPQKACYISTLSAHARSGKGRKAAEQAESILEDMENLREEFPFLSPTTLCVNIVLDAWSKSGDRRASRRCRAILRRLELLSENGRNELQPDTTSFNTVLNALAHSQERGSERRAESLLEHMDELSSREHNPLTNCMPDNVSFNIVLKNWARSRDDAAARRADAILRHMERRYADGDTSIQPDVATYNTVLTAWARSKDPDATNRAEQVLNRMEELYAEGNMLIRPNALTYNIMINALAKSNNSERIGLALDILKRMKDLSSKEGRQDCRPDVYSYTAAIDALAKLSTIESSRSAEMLLEELEAEYAATKDVAVKPNIRTYTSVIHAIARSRTDPERALKVVNRLESMFESGETDVQPDVICYDALINAFGWSSVPGRAKRCYEIYKKMLNGYESGTNVHAKPDIITCNSVLNACAYEEIDDDDEKEEIMRIVVDTLEAFQSAAPKFGWPNHMTFAHVLLAISKHMSEDDVKRADLAEATFWQCCDSGHVSVLVITQLHRALSWNRFSRLLGEALFSEENEKLGFNLRKLPREWTRFAPKPKQRQGSRPSRRRPKMEVTKSLLSQKRGQKQ